MRTTFANRASRWLVGSMLLVAAGCGDTYTTIVEPDTGPICRSDAQCDDGVFCNGAERCSPDHAAADAVGCLPAGAPCTAGQTCDEAAGVCRDTCSTPDADGDGHTALACGGDDCDDTDATRFPGNPEVCDAEGHDEDCNPSTLGPDGDGDGVPSNQCCNRDGAGLLVCGADCDDSLAGVNPGATEACNNIDDDCDGLIDDGVQRAFYPDTDGDGFGDRDATPVAACTPPTSEHVEDQRDCDDGNSAKNPGTSELCDGVDNDCDGVTDESGFVTYYADADGDGFGDARQPLVLMDCTTPSGLSANGTDCDDADADVHPGAAELCDRRDTNCSLTGDARGGVDPDEDRDEDGHAAMDAACEGGLPKDDCDDDRAATHPGAPETCSGQDDNCDGAMDEGGDAFCGAGYACDGTCVATGTLASEPLARTHCVVRAGDVYCWGPSTSFAGGDDAYLAASVDGLPTDVQQVAIGRDHACARSATGTVHCWGSNERGQLGAGDASPHAAPVTVAGITDAVDLALGDEFSCALRRDGTVACWGDNLARQLGDIALGAFVTIPVTIADVGDAIGVVATWRTACVRRRDERVVCWGDNDTGQVGDGTTGGSRGATSVPGLVGARELLGGRSVFVAKLASGTVVGWGGELGASVAPLPLGTSVESLFYARGAIGVDTVAGMSFYGEGFYAPAGTTPDTDGYVFVPLTVPTPDAWSGACRVLGAEVSCSTRYPSATPRVSALSAPDEIRTQVFTSNACVRQGDRVYCWGLWWSGNGSEQRRTLVPEDVGLAGVVDIDTNGRMACAALDDGTLWCWGDGGLLESSGVPVQVQNAPAGVSRVSLRCADVIGVTGHRRRYPLRAPLWIVRIGRWRAHRSRRRRLVRDHRDDGGRVRWRGDAAGRSGVLRGLDAGVWSDGRG